MQAPSSSLPPRELSSALCTLEKLGKLPRVKAFCRLDGPGSTLDLREFQAALFTVPATCAPEGEPDFGLWSRKLPRTIGMTLGNVGCQVTARPLPPGCVGITSNDFGYDLRCKAGHVPYRREYWLLKLLDGFGLSGIRVELSNLTPGIKASGLGGSATAAMGVVLLANALTGRPFSGEQMVAMASLLEQDLGVSITGTQEQSNVVFGGATDYVWFPWGVPGKAGSFGTSLRRSLLDVAHYPELSQHVRIYHTGVERASTDVNAVWRTRLEDADGYDLHLQQVETAYRFREALRLRDWPAAAGCIADYRRVRVTLCAEYMTGRCWDIQSQCERFGAEAFPLGAGGGGAVLIFGREARPLTQLDQLLAPVYRRVPSDLRATGHEFENIDAFEETVMGGSQ